MAMWGVLSLVRRGLRLRLRRRRTARVVDESALAHHADAGNAGVDELTAAVVGAGRAAAPGALARALLLAMAFAAGLGGEDVRGAEEAWTGTAWRPRADEVSHQLVRESMRYAIYA